jgi:predicted aspartyl protease
MSLFSKFVGCGIGILAFSGAGAEVPLLWDSTGHVVVPTIVNGQGPIDFMFDTGADETSVYLWLTRKLELPTGGSGKIDGATGSAATVMSRLSTLSVDGHAIGAVSAVTLPDRPDAPQLGGIVGFDLMAGRLAVADFGCNTLSLQPLETVRMAAGPRTYRVNAGSITDGKQLSFTVRINGAPGIALLDSGARSSLINGKFAAAAGIDARSAGFHDGEPARGATRAGVSSRIGPIGTVEFAGIRRTNVTARVAELPVFEDASLANQGAMILGLDLLRGTRLSVDVSGRRFWVAPSRCTNK